MPVSDNNKDDDFSSAKSMIEGAFKDDEEGHPLDFVRERPFRGLMSEIIEVFEKNGVGTKELLCCVVELLLRTTGYSTTDPASAKLAARAAPIIRQLLYEHKQAPEIIVIVSAILTQLALHACIE